MVYYAVIDTNVFISALLSKRTDAATVRVLDAMFDGKIIPLYHEDILSEYDEVLHRSKFHFKEETIRLVINAVKQYGVEYRTKTLGIFVREIIGLGMNLCMGIRKVVEQINVNVVVFFIAIRKAVK